MNDKSETDLEHLYQWVQQYDPSLLVNEDDVDTKFVIPFFRLLGYLENCRRSKYPIKAYLPGKKGRKSEADHVFFSTSDLKEQDPQTSLFVVESKTPDKKLDDVKEQVDFYSEYIKPVCVAITNGDQIIVFKKHQYRSDEMLFETSITELNSKEYLNEFYQQLNFQSLKRIRETLTSELTHRAILQIDQTLRDKPDLQKILKSTPFIPSQTQNDREFTVVRRKAAINGTLPVALDGGRCQIEFSDAFLRGLLISLDHTDILEYLLL